MSKPLDGWTLVFDLDGTLVETAPDLLSALNATLTHMQLLPVEMSVIRPLISEGAMVMLRAGITHQGGDPDAQDLKPHWNYFIDYYSRNIAVDSHLFDGAEQALQALSAKGATLAICTNKTQNLAERVLHELGVAACFKAVVGADAVPNRKPHGDHILLTINAAGGLPAKAIMIGDSPTDEKAARNAGLPFIFVPFGYASEQADRLGNNATAVVTHFSDLVSSVLAIAA